MRQRLKTFLRVLENLIFPPKKKGEPLWRTPLRALPVIAICVTLTYFLHHAGLLSALENAALDTFLRINPIVQKHTLIVDITDKDYKKEFESKSPLRADMLKRLLEAIIQGEPRVVVVDLDTGDPSFTGLRDLKPGSTSIVWARSYQLPEHGHEGDHSQHHDICATALQPGPVLGGLGNHPMLSAIAAMVAGTDGVVRGYCLHALVQEYEHGTPVEQATLPWQAVKAFDSNASWPESDDKAMFNFSYDRKQMHRYTSSRVLEWVRENPASWKEMVTNQIVVLGGTYREGRDFQMTPVGNMAGVELVALAIESHLQNKAIRPVSNVNLVTADLVAGMAFVVLTCLLPQSWVLILAVIIAPVFAGMVSFLAFSKLSMWASFVPVIFGVYVHVLHDHIHEDRELRRELKHLEVQVHQLQSGGHKPESDSL